MSHKLNDSTDSIDYITERLTVILIKNQDLNFSSLSKLALFRDDSQSSEMYLELVILSFIKYLHLDQSFKFTIKENVPSHKIFNALNLNDDKVNFHFVSFISLVAPDIITTLCTVTAQIAAEFAKSNIRSDSVSRIERIQEKVNAILLNDEESTILESNNFESKIELKRTSKTKKRNLSFAQYIAGPSNQHKNRNRSKSYELSSDNSNNTVSTSASSPVENKKTRSKKLNLLPTLNDESETASATSRRIARNRGIEIEVQELPDADFNALPTREEIRNAKYSDDIAKKDIEVVSSVSF